MLCITDGYLKILKSEISEIIENDLEDDDDRTDENFDLCIKVKVRKGKCEVFANTVDLND